MRLECVTDSHLTDAETGLSQRRYIETIPEQGSRASSQHRLVTVRAGLSPCLNATKQSRLPLPAGPKWQIIGALGLWNGNDENGDILSWYWFGSSLYKVSSTLTTSLLGVSPYFPFHDEQADWGK